MIVKIFAFLQSNYNFQLVVLLPVYIAPIIFPRNRCYGNTWNGSRASEPNNLLKTSHFPNQKSLSSTIFDYNSIYLPRQPLPW